MAQSPSSRSKAYTAWHPLFVSVLRQLLPPQDFEVLAELLLNEQPQRIDTVVVRKTHPGPEPRSRVLRALLLRLGLHTIIEFKGPTSVLDTCDFLWLFGYAYQYAAQARLTAPDELHLFVVANRLSGPFRDMVSRYGGTLHPEGPGIWLASGLAFRLYVFETEHGEDAVLHFFSRLLLRKARHLASLLSDEERAILRSIYREVKQFQKDSDAPLRYADYEELIMSADEFLEEIAKDMPREKLRALVPPEERLLGLTPEELPRALHGLSLEERLRGLTPEEREQIRRLLEH